MVKARQMAGGLNEKFKAIKEIRPFLEPLKSRGLIDDPSKFNLAMQIIDGDKEALKQLMQERGIDPLVDEDMDMENIQYQEKNTLSSKEAIIYDDSLAVAKQYGVEDKFNKVVLDEWDSKSLSVILGDSSLATEVSARLSQQISNGIYDEVMSEVENFESRDIDGSFGAKTSIEKYNIAADIVNARHFGKSSEKQVTENQVDVSKVEKAKKRIEEKRKKDSYTKKVKEQNRRADSERKKATASSSKKSKVAPAKKVDPYSLEGDDLDEFVNELMDSFR